MYTYMLTVWIILIIIISSLCNNILCMQFRSCSAWDWKQKAVTFWAMMIFKQNDIKQQTQHSLQFYEMMNESLFIFSLGRAFMFWIFPNGIIPTQVWQLVWKTNLSRSLCRAHYYIQNGTKFLQFRHSIGLASHK